MAVSSMAEGDTKDEMAALCFLIAVGMQRVWVSGGSGEKENLLQNAKGYRSLVELEPLTQVRKCVAN